MKSSAGLFSVSCLVIALGGCAATAGFAPRYATSAEAMDRLGRPTDVRRDRNGDELWDYATGPSGFETWRLRVEPGGRVSGVTQLVTEERLMTIELGKTTKDEVAYILGRPSEVEWVGTGEAWSWRTLVGVEPGHLVVTFNPDGTARERMALRDPIIDDDHE